MLMLMFLLCQYHVDVLIYGVSGELELKVEDEEKKKELYICIRV